MPHVTVKQAIEDYLNSDKMQRRADKTQAAHRRAMRLLAEVCSPRMLATRITSVEIDKTLALARSRSSAKEYSLNVIRAGLKGFVRFCHGAGYLPVTSNPTAGLEYEPFAPTNPNKRKPLTKEQAILLIETAGEQHPRDRIGCTMAILTGMRESELTEVRWRDINWIDREIRFYRKKVKDWHTAPFTPTLEAELRIWHKWYSERHPEMDPGWYVVPARQRGMGPAHRITPDWPIVPTQRARFSDTLKRLLAAIGVTDLDGKGCHTLRRTYANLFYEETNDMRAVMEGLGHSSLGVTEVYMDKSVQREKNRKTLAGWELRPAQRPDNVIQLRRAS